MTSIIALGNAIEFAADMTTDNDYLSRINALNINPKAIEALTALAFTLETAAVDFGSNPHHWRRWYFADADAVVTLYCALTECIRLAETDSTDKAAIRANMKTVRNWYKVYIAN